MTPAERGKRAMLVGIVCAVGGGGATIFGAIADPGDFYPAWLAAFYFGLSIPLGALALLMIHDLSGGRWVILARAPLEAATATLPIFMLAFLPLIPGFNELYSWTRPGSSSLPNSWYLNLDWFGIRAGIYFVIWNVFALWRVWRSPAALPVQWASGIGLVLLGGTVTWASFDWLMSIEPQWFSSIYGMMIGSGQFIIALACVLAVVVAAEHPVALTETAFRRDLAKLATILLTVVVFWGFASWSQWLIIWEENLHSEIPWYIERLDDFWRWFVLAIIAVHFVIPLFTLIWPQAKHSPWIVGTISGMLLAGGIMQLWWLILPAFGMQLSWIDATAVLALGGIWLCLFLWRLDRGRFIPAFGSAPLKEAQ